MPITKDDAVKVGKKHLKLVLYMPIKDALTLPYDTIEDTFIRYFWVTLSHAREKIHQLRSKPNE